jgi:hypothetical protein
MPRVRQQRPRISEKQLKLGGEVLMSKDSIRLSPKHGANPMLCLCFFCHEETGEIALLGLLADDAKAPHRGVLDHTPCTKCKEYMEQGVILVAVRDGETGENPYRTGPIAVVTEDGIRRMIEDEKLRSQVLKSRFCYVPETAWAHIGLPTGDAAADKRNREEGICEEEGCSHEHSRD